MSHISKDKFNAPCPLVSIMALQAHRSFLQSDDDDDDDGGMTLMGKRHGGKFTTRHSKVLVDHLSLMGNKGHTRFAAQLSKHMFL